MHYEKLGIEVVLLPGGERLPFAKRRDLCDKSGGDSGCGNRESGESRESGKAAIHPTSTAEADRAQLGWAIRDDSLAAVNRHFEMLCDKRDKRDKRGDFVLSDGQDTPLSMPLGGLLVVDELGRLELEHDGGFTAAVRLLEAGPSTAWPHALIVIRSALVEKAYERFSASWGAVSIIAPDEPSFKSCLDLYAPARHRDG
jgi:hypothetical protein